MLTVIQTWETLLLVGKTGKLVNVSQGESGGKGDKGPGDRRGSLSSSLGMGLSQYCQVVLTKRRKVELGQITENLDFL